MNKRGGFGSMADRVAATRATDTAPVSPTLKHCWVTDRHGRLPGLLLRWQQRPDGWYGRVVRPVHEDDGWLVVEEWLPAQLLEPAAG